MFEITAIAPQPPPPPKVPYIIPIKKKEYKPNLNLPGFQFYWTAKMTNCVGILQFDRQLHLSLAFSSPERTRANWVIFQSENCNKTNFSRFCLSMWVDTG